MESRSNGVFHIQKNLAIAMVIFILVLNFFCNIGCSIILGPGQLDWEYSLPNGYYVARINSTDIRISNSIQGGVRTDRYITCFAYNDTYVCARRLEVPEELYIFDELMDMNFEEAKYLIINTSTGELYDSLEKIDFDIKCKELGITNLCDWIATYPKPEQAR